MAKVEVDIVKMVLQRNLHDIRAVAQILEEIAQETANQEEEKKPRIKKQFAVLVSDPQQTLKGMDLIGWILQIPEEESPHSVKQRVIDAAYEFNQSPRGRRMPVKTIGEACESVQAKFLKEQNVWVKTKEPIYFIHTDNIIPRDTSLSDLPQGTINPELDPEAF